MSKQNVGKIEDLLQTQKWVDKEPSTSWMLLKAMRWDTFNAMKELHEGGRIIPGVDFERFRRLLCESALHNLRVMGYVLHDAPPVRVSTSEATATIANLWNVDLTETITETINYIFGEPKTKKKREPIVASSDDEPQPGPSGLQGTLGPAFRAVAGTLSSWGDIMDLVSSDSDSDDSEPLTKRPYVEEKPEEPKEPLRQEEGFFDMPNLNLTDIIDVDAFGEPPFEIMPQSLYCHTDLAKDILATKILPSLGTHDVASLLSQGSCWATKEADARLLLWVLQRENQALSLLTNPDVRTDDYEVGPVKTDISQFG